MSEAKDYLVKLVIEKAGEAETYYLENGPNKHEQEAHYTNGISVVRMNVKLLENWLDSQSTAEDDLYETFRDMPSEERKEVWEASKFHFGIMGYRKRHSDLYWKDETLSQCHEEEFDED